jgi:hypothetical protein
MPRALRACGPVMGYRRGTPAAAPDPARPANDVSIGGTLVGQWLPSFARPVAQGRTAAATTRTSTHRAPTRASLAMAQPSCDAGGTVQRHPERQGVPARTPCRCPPACCLTAGSSARPPRAKRVTRATGVTGRGQGWVVRRRYGEASRERRSPCGRPHSVTQHRFGPGSSVATTSRQPIPSSIASIRSRFIPQTSAACSRASA